MKKITIVFSLMLMLLTTAGWGLQADTSRNSDPARDQASPGSGPGGRELLQDTGGKSGLRGKSDTGRSINDQSTSKTVKDRSANDKYFSIGAALLIVIIIAALAVRYRSRPRP
jgi:hypothetical protein